MSVIIPVICSNTNVEPTTTNVPPLSVNYATADGTAIGGIHYTPVSGTLLYSNGMATNYFVVPLINNGIIDSNRTFSVSLSSPTPPGQVISPGTQLVTIVERISLVSTSQVRPIRYSEMGAYRPTSLSIAWASPTP